ncbi:MAG: N-6 DNA methylase, partial [Proteobacteria bacterium]|nr:N-6 DNA methylase [Pseudomonadota bacterium]
MADKKDIDAIRTFIKKVRGKYEKGDAQEHSYRPYLVELIETLGSDKKIEALNEGRHIGQNAPDIIIKRDDIAIGYIEAKNVGVPIRDKKGPNKEQRDRYKKDLPNLVYTNNLDWNFYRNGDFVHSISIAEFMNHTITSKPNNFVDLVDYLKDVLDQNPQTITTAEELTEYMARKTIIIRNAFIKKLTGQDRLPRLEKQYNTIVKQLIRWLKKEEFADMYAQTVTYGLFVARLNNTPETFNREKLQDLVPEHYSFLKDLFEFISTKTLGDTLYLYIDDLIKIYRAADVEKIMKDYKKGPDGKDPFLHFYEDFLKEYDSENRANKGVYYTPEPVVDFIVRGVDWVLENKFSLAGGLANSEKTKVPWKTDKAGKLKYRDFHKVQILDPATGTGTFLAQTIRHIAKTINTTTPGLWPAYVDTDLLPRLHGFEIMMAPYVMCYLKLNMVLAELGYTPPKKNPKRMSIYLTDSLTNTNKETSDLGFGNDWIEEESEGAKKIKDNLPIMCVIGNPPYNAKSKNTDKWIERLIQAYKKEPATEDKLDEENFQSLSDDYVKFIRLAQHMVEKNGEGVVGMITAHGYLDNPTFRGMRWHLMNSFDAIYVLDLHGNSLKKDVKLNGDPDKNVFNITTGVSIIIAWKTKREKGTDKPLSQVFRGDLWGEREEKFKALEAGSLDTEIQNIN